MVGDGAKKLRCLYNCGYGGPISDVATKATVALQVEPMAAVESVKW